MKPKHANPQNASKAAGPLSVGILSLGCPKTLVDSEVIAGKLDSRQYRLAETVADCDIALINTCGFIRDAQEESIDRILELIELKKQGRVRFVVVIGCLVQRFLRPLRKDLREVDAFVGSGDYDRIPEVLMRLGNSRRI